MWLDVNRSMCCLDALDLQPSAPSSASAAASALLTQRRQQLHDVIMSVLYSDTAFRYTQGFHDFCAVALHVMDAGRFASDGGQVARDFICAVGRRLLRPSLCDSTLDDAVAACARVFRALLVIDPPLAQHLQAVDVNPTVCLSWVLTLFTHSLSGHVSQAVEVLDFIFACDDDYTVLLCACAIADNSQSLLQIQDGGEAYRAVQSCAVASLLPPHRRRLCLCRALQISLSKYNKVPCDEGVSAAACIAAAAPAAPPAHAFISRSSRLHGIRP